MPPLTRPSDVWPHCVRQCYMGIAQRFCITPPSPPPPPSPPSPASSPPPSPASQASEDDPSLGESAQTAEDTGANVGAAVGGAVGGVAALAVVIGVVFCCLKKKAQAAKPPAAGVEVKSVGVEHI